jgi:hypothetical protein
MARNRERPRLHRIPRVVGVTRAVQLEKRILQQIVRFLYCSHAAAQPPTQCRREGVMKRLERRQVSCLVSRHQRAESYVFHICR